VARIEVVPRSGNYYLNSTLNTPHYTLHTTNYFFRSCIKQENTVNTCKKKKVAFHPWFTYYKHGGTPKKKRLKSMDVKRGELYYADLSPVVGSEQGGVRPVLVVQNDVGNKYSPTVIAAAVTSRMNKAKLPTHIELPSASAPGLAKDSVILLEQIRTLDKRRLKERIGELTPATMSLVNKAILISLGFMDTKS
jgi:mRNA interferase MazF